MAVLTVQASGDDVDAAKVRLKRDASVGDLKEKLSSQASHEKQHIFPASHEKQQIAPDVATADKAVDIVEQTSLFMSLVACLVWPCICALPLCLTLGGTAYRSVFPASWYDEVPVQQAIGAYGVANPSSVKPLGLILGLAAVAVGQVAMLTYHVLRRNSMLGGTKRIQPQKRDYNFFEGLKEHLAQPEGFGLLGSYLIGTWMLGWMPASYYSFAGGINWKHVAIQLLLQDSIQAFMHYGEHKISAWVYKMSHKPHHRFTNPRVFDAFDGSVTDTICMILVPMVITSRLVPANVWSYMTFGSLYANWLVLIHSEYTHPWDGIFRRLGFGTAADHHVHHRLFVFNYGHLFMYWDKALGTYRDPKMLGGTHFNKDV